MNQWVGMNRHDAQRAMEELRRTIATMLRSTADQAVIVERISAHLNDKCGEDVEYEICISWSDEISERSVRIRIQGPEFPRRDFTVLASHGLAPENDER